MATTLPTMFVQLNDEPAAWSTFLYKASKGSVKAVDTVLRCEWELLSGVEDDYDHHRLELVPAGCPFKTAQEFLDHLTLRGHLGGRMLSPGRLFHAESDFYRNLWAAKRTVHEVELLHDAVLHAASSWS